MPDYPCLSFLTDYGLEDGFVAACHGVMARLAPGVRVIDVSHLVPPGDVRRGATVLAQTLPHLPNGVHVGVVDPGVGTARRAVAVAAGGHLLVGPDNGLLVVAAQHLGGPAAAHEITNPAAMLHPVSATFHGRDVFAPAAARLATGTLGLRDVGAEIDVLSLHRLPEPVVEVGEGFAAGEVLTVDRFGNVQTTVTRAQLMASGAVEGGRLVVEAAGRRWTVPYGPTFDSVPEGELLAYEDSAGLVALAVNRGRAATLLGLHPGVAVRLGGA